MTTSSDRDLVYYIRILIKSWIFIVAVTLGGTLATIGVNLRYLPKKYEASVVYMIPPSESQGNAMSQYSKLLGGGDGVDIDRFLTALLKSDTLKHMVTTRVHKKYPELFADIDRQQISMSKKKWLYVRRLQLSSNLGFMKTKENATEISYVHSNPVLAYDVVVFSLESLRILNEQLSLSEKREIFVVIDGPTYPVVNSFPKVVRNSILAVFLSGILSCLLAIIWAESKIIIKRIRTQPSE